MPLSVLPAEVLTSILSYLTTTAHLPLQYQLVCHQWHECKEPVRQTKLHEIDHRIATGQFSWKLVDASQTSSKLPSRSQPIDIPAPTATITARGVSRSTVFNPSPPPNDVLSLTPLQSPPTPAENLFQRSRPVEIRQSNPTSTRFISSFFSSRYYNPSASHSLAHSHAIQSADSINDEYEAGMSVTDTGSNAYNLTAPAPTSISSVSQLTKLLMSLSDVKKDEVQHNSQPNSTLPPPMEPQYNHLETLQAHSTLLETAPALHAHTACSVSQHLVYTFAGSSRMYDIRGDSTLYAYHTQHNQWYRVEATGTIPTPRTFAPLVYVQQQHCLLTFGGQNRDLQGKWSFFNEIYICDLYTYQWTRVESDEQLKPCARVGHRMQVVGDYAYIYGGTYCTVPANPVAGQDQPLLGAATPTYIYLDDFWSLYLPTYTWKQQTLLPYIQDCKHLPQACHSYEMCHLPYINPVTKQLQPHLLLYGGNADVYSAKNLSDVHLIDLSVMVCRRLKLTCLVPQYSSDSADADSDLQSIDSQLTAIDDVESPTNAANASQQPALPASVLTGYHSKPQLPSARWCANLTTMASHIVLCGGYRSRTTPSDFSLKHVYTLDWQQMLSNIYQHTPLAQPSLPVQHSAEVLKSATLRSPSLASLYDGYWLRRTTTSSSKIPARTFSCMVCVGEVDVVLMGGAIRGTPVNEVLRLL